MASGDKIRIRLRAFDHKLLDQSAQQIVATARAALGSKPFTEVWADGGAYTIEQALVGARELANTITAEFENMRTTAAERAAT